MAKSTPKPSKQKVASPSEKKLSVKPSITKTKATKDKVTKAKVPWLRVSKGGRWTTAVDRDVDETAILALLNERTAAKEAKDFTRADECAAELQRLDVCYVDGEAAWYTTATAATVGVVSGTGSAGGAKRIRPSAKRPPGHVRERQRKQNKEQKNKGST
jgi:hypothetical protein